MDTFYLTRLGPVEAHTWNYSKRVPCSAVVVCVRSSRTPACQTGAPSLTRSRGTHFKRPRSSATCNVPHQPARSPRHSGPPQSDTPPIIRRHLAKNSKGFTRTLSKYKWCKDDNTQKNPYCSLKLSSTHPPDTSHVGPTKGRNLVKAAPSAPLLGGTASQVQAPAVPGTESFTKAVYCHRATIRHQRAV